MFDRLTGRTAAPLPTGMTPEQVVMLRSVHAMLESLTRRVTRMETRLVMLMKHEHIDQYGQPIEGEDDATQRQGA